MRSRQEAFARLTDWLSGYRMRGVAFYDWGRVTRIEPLPSEPHRQSISSAGLGVRVSSQSARRAFYITLLHLFFEGLEQRVLLQRMIEHRLGLGDGAFQQFGKYELRIGIVGQILFDALF